MSNTPIELLVMLGISTQESARNLKQQIKNLEKNNLGNLEIALALNKQSIANVGQTIKAIQNNIGDIDVSLNVKSSSTTTNIIGDMDKQTTALIGKFDELIAKLTKVADPPPKKKTPKILGGIQDDVINTMTDLKQLETYLKSQGYSVDVKFSVDKNGQEKVKHVLAQIKNQAGELETLKIKPVIDQKTGVSSFSLYGSGNKDDNQRDFIKNQSEAYELLAKIERQGKLTANQIKEYNKRIGEADGNTALESELKLLRQLNQERASGLKIGAGNADFRNQTRDAIQNLEQLKQTANNLGLNTSQYDKLINRMQTLSKIDITNEEQLKKADRIFGKLSSQMSALRNNTASYSTAFNSLFGALDNAAYKGTLTADVIDGIKMKILSLNSQNLTLDEKLRIIREEATKVSTVLEQVSRSNTIEGKTQKLRSEIAKLEAQLTKTMNSYKRTINMDSANAIQNQLSGMSRNMPKFTNLEDIKRYQAQLNTVENQIRKLNAEATVGARNSMSVIESFKVAMEK